MGWTKETSRERVSGIANRIGDVEISDLTREMDLENVTLRRPKRIRGVHLYLGPSNEKRLVDDLLSVDQTDEARRILRRLHLFQRESGRIVRDFDAAQVHFQGARLHVLTYRPVGDQEEIAVRAVSMAFAIDLAARRALREILPDDPLLDCSAGAAYGTTIATMSGPRGESELLFVGDAANQGAKSIDPGHRVRVTADLRELLDDSRYGIEVTDLGDGTYSLSMDQEAIEEAASLFAGGWTLGRSRKRLEDDANKLPLEAFSISKATAEINKDTLGRANSKLNHSVSAFGDLDGFTGVIESATTDSELEQLIRAFHIVRYELNHVRKDDYPGTFRVQYQGDRIQVLRHLPHDDSADRAVAALRVAAGWQSSIRETLPEVIRRDDLRLAIGLAAGPTLISKLGTTGNRDVLAIGPDVRRAERIQRNLDGDEVGIDAGVRDELPEDVAGLFEWRPGAQGFVASDLRVNQLEYALQAESLIAGETQRIEQDAGRHRVGPARAAAAATEVGSQVSRTDVRPKRRWAR